MGFEATRGKFIGTIHLDSEKSCIGGQAKRLFSVFRLCSNRSICVVTFLRFFKSILSKQFALKLLKFCDFSHVSSSNCGNFCGFIFFIKSILKSVFEGGTFLFLVLLDIIFLLPCDYGVLHLTILVRWKLSVLRLLKFQQVCTFMLYIFSSPFSKV